MIWRQHCGNTTPRRQTCIVNGCKTIQAACNGVTMRGDIVPFSGIGISLSGSRHTQEKVARPSRVWMTHSEEPRVAESGLQLPNETEYSFGAFLWREILPIVKQLNRTVLLNWQSSHNSVYLAVPILIKYCLRVFIRTTRTLIFNTTWINEPFLLCCCRHTVMNNFAGKVALITGKWSLNYSFVEQDSSQTTLCLCVCVCVSMGTKYIKWSNDYTNKVSFGRTPSMAKEWDV